MAEEVKNDKQQTEKPLDKMTVVELDQLLAAMKEARGIKDEKAAKKKKKKAAGPKKEMTIREMKQEIVRLRAEKESIRPEGDKKKIEIIRRRINRLKKMTRKAA
jgi:ribosomal protein L7/L12